ncbi:hypothetical protein B0A48_14802 [Cryoendolithus antarcticus]|uniref:Uncharacterized protein n=1 Tax=Cryoendolithus antarcticus TaxID=1507870 RepID=A0A1V8SL45_9PEZI|nr:hypothetical protein B0A48_14802 [Cryoendolithus antarcticus]OQO26189.1 hypothetical protein B0A51_08301 [Rachicladosporium sp. CCFEE 5018]
MAPSPSELNSFTSIYKGDYRNTDAWYGDVSESEVFQSVWGSEGGLEGANGFVKRVEGLRKEGKGNKEELVKESGREIEALKDYLLNKFGTEQIKDATTVWVGKSEKGKEAAKNMVVGGEGWRQF